MKIAVSSDMRAPMVDKVLSWLREHGHEALYSGPSRSGDEADWPVVSRAAAAAVRDGEVHGAIVICWTGTGACLCANKVRGVRAALCADAPTARGARKWNHANVLALSIRATTEAVAEEILEAWFDEPFARDEWSRRQIARIEAMEREDRPTGGGES